MNFIERLEYLLKKNKITQAQLSDKIGLRRATISDWKKNGNYPSADDAVKIAKILDVSTDWLITGEDPQGLTEEERRLVGDWRELGADARKAVRAVLDTFVAESFEEKKVQAGKA